MIRSVSDATPSKGGGLTGRLVSVLLSVGLMVVLCPMGAVQAQAAADDPSDAIHSNGGVGLADDIDRAKVRTITFQNSKPTGVKCWDAGGGRGATTNDTVKGCATQSGGMWDVTYGADNAYPKFPNISNALFDEFTGLVAINNLDKIDVSNVTDMSYMFYKCSALTTLNVTNWNVSNVTDMFSLFYGCESLSILDLSGWNTSKVETPYEMLSRLSKLEEIRLGANFTLRPQSDAGLNMPNWYTTRAGYVNIHKWRNMQTGETYESGTYNMPANVAATYTPFAPVSEYTYTVHYDANGGSGTMNDQQILVDSYDNLTANTFTRSGWTFTGWNTKKDGTGTAYKDKKDVQNLTTAGKTVTLYAQWARTDGKMLRLSGVGRYDTMGKIVAQAYPNTASTVIVASGANYPDALSASGLSGVLNAPIVLTDPASLSSQTIDQLKRLKPSKIIIAGGEVAVSAKVASQLKQYTTTVTRLSGGTRYDTSYLLYEQGGNSWGDTAIVATGAGYADALSVSSYAYAGKAPVFLCDPASGLTAKQRTALSKFKRVVVVGGVAAVPAKYVSGLPGVTRLSGAGRYETSVKLAEWTAQNGLSMDGVVYATGDNFPDALVSGPLAGVNKAPVLLVGDTNSPTITYSAGFKGKVSKAYVAGGTAAVSASTANALANALGVTKP